MKPGPVNFTLKLIEPEVAGKRQSIIAERLRQPVEFALEEIKTQLKQIRAYTARSLASLKTKLTRTLARVSKTQDLKLGTIFAKDAQEAEEALIARLRCKLSKQRAAELLQKLREWIDDVSAEEERRAWAEFWSYIRSLPEDEWAMYYYSKYERTQFRALASKYSDVASAEEVEWLFDPTRSIDLYYDIVKKYTEWPTYNYSIKTLAQHLGFNWRDENPSGAASIQWFNEWCESKDPKTLQRILDYNEDDCIAMIVLKDKLSSVFLPHLPV